MFFITHELHLVYVFILEIRAGQYKRTEINRRGGSFVANQEQHIKLLRLLSMIEGKASILSIMISTCY